MLFSAIKLTFKYIMLFARLGEEMTPSHRRVHFFGPIGLTPLGPSTFRCHAVFVFGLGAIHKVQYGTVVTLDVRVGFV